MPPRLHSGSASAPGSDFKGTCLARIRARLRDGSRTSLRISRFILRSPGRAQGMSIAALAAACGTSTASISRFCKDLEYLSFKDFQLDLAASLARNNGIVLEDFAPGATPKAIIRRVFEANRQSLSDTEQVVDHSRLIQAARLLRRARRIFLLGSGGSALVATEAEQRFLSLGLTAIALGDAYTMIFATSSVGRKDVVFGISHTGQNPFVIEALSQARRRGARTIALTNYPRSPVAAGAEIALITAYQEHRINAAVSSSRIAQMCVIDSLYFILGSWGARRARKLVEEEEKRARRILRVPAPAKVKTVKSP
jgi:DNA-binding MurR/RpiR family transcriptional regulator